MLTAATTAQAVNQDPKNGCTSPQPYSGAITTPTFTGDIEFGSTVNFQGWFEIESVAPLSFDTISVEYSLDPGSGGTREWIPFGALTDAAQGVPANSGGASDQPYSNNGTNVAPSFQPYSFPLPTEALNQPGTQVRINFATGDDTYQGFRAVGIDNFAITNTNVSANFEAGVPAGWTFDPAGGPGGPFWQVPSSPTSISVKSPEINPNLVTLPDAGALPAPPVGAGANTRYAWFGNVASGTFCGPDFGNLNPLPDTSITSGPAAVTAAKDATFAFAATEAAFFQCQLDGGPLTPCASPQTYSDLSNGAHTFSVAATSFAGRADPTPATYTWTIREATLADLDNPGLGVDFNADQVSGIVRVGVRGAAARASGSGRASQKGITFVPLSEARQIPVGSFLDTRRGSVRLESAANARGKRQRGTFFQGLFQVRQSKKRSARGLTDLVLKGSSFRGCRAGGSSDASASGSRTIRRVRGNARGRFRTSGRNSSATVRGTKWGVTDRCDGTLTKVQRGSVVVRDFRRKRNIVVRAGKSYLAKAPG